MKELICIICPRGCHLVVDENLNVSGNNCPRGEIYAKNELTNPTRTLTSTVKIISKKACRLPVKSEKPIAKNLLFNAMDEINKVTTKSPVRIGDIVIKNICNTGINIIACKTILE